MSTRPSQRALAFFFISLLAAGIGARASGEVAPHAVRAVEIESRLAAKKDAYIVIGVYSRTILIRARGVTLETLPLESINAIERRHWWSSRSREQVSLPRLFTVAATVGLSERKVVAPLSLKPWEPGTETGHSPQPDDSLLPPPALYDVALDGGWVLEIREKTRALSTANRLYGAVFDGLHQLVSLSRETQRPAIRLVLAGDDAKKLHHLFRKEMSLLVVTEPLDLRPVTRSR